MEYEEIIEWIRSMENKENVEWMARYGINPENCYGINVTTLRKKAREIGRDHDLASKLWGSGIHDARMLAPHVEEIEKVTEEQMEAWALDFDSWDICDNCCGHLFDKTPYAYGKAREWSGREELFVKRAAFSLIAWLSVHDKEAPDSRFESLFPIIKQGAGDDRNYVKKAVSWALRSIGKRDLALNRKAINAAEEIKGMDSRPAKWIAGDVLRELTSEKVQERLRARGEKRRK